MEYQSEGGARAAYCIPARVKGGWGWEHSSVCCCCLLSVVACSRGGSRGVGHDPQRPTPATHPQRPTPSDPRRPTPQRPTPSDPPRRPTPATHPSDPPIKKKINNSPGHRPRACQISQYLVSSDLLNIPIF